MSYINLNALPIRNKANSKVNTKPNILHLLSLKKLIFAALQYQIRNYRCVLYQVRVS